MMQPEPIAYATPQYQRSSPVTAGFLLGLLGLGLIFLGGCFMIGIMVLQFGDQSAGFGNSATAQYWTISRITFDALLYVCAFACFAGGAVVIKRGVQKLMFG